VEVPGGARPRFSREEGGRRESRPGPGVNQCKSGAIPMIMRRSGKRARIASHELPGTRSVPELEDHVSSNVLSILFVFRRVSDEGEFLSLRPEFIRHRLRPYLDDEGIDTGKDDD